MRPALPRPTGFANLKLAADLLEKMRFDLDRIRRDRRDSYAAFDFFVTAHHIWEWPGDVSGEEFTEEEIQLLKVVSQLANGAKHFETDDKRHKSVEDVTVRGGAFSARAFSARSFSNSAFSKGGIFIDLADGNRVGVLTLANQVIEFWEKRIT